MKRLLSLFMISSCFVMYACDDMPIAYSMAENWEEVTRYKEPVYMPFFEKCGFEKKYLEQRWDVLNNLYNTKLVKILLLKRLSNSDQDVRLGFLTIESQDKNALLYTSPILIAPDKIDPLLTSVVHDFYPQVDTGYCMVAQNNQLLKKFVESIGWKETDECPIAPNKQFVQGISYSMFTKKLAHK